MRPWRTHKKSFFSIASDQEQRILLRPKRLHVVQWSRGCLQRYQKGGGKWRRWNEWWRRRLWAGSQLLHHEFLQSEYSRTGQFIQIRVDRDRLRVFALFVFETRECSKKSAHKQFCIQVDRQTDRHKDRQTLRQAFKDEGKNWCIDGRKKTFPLPRRRSVSWWAWYWASFYSPSSPTLSTPKSSTNPTPTPTIITTTPTSTKEEDTRRGEAPSRDPNPESIVEFHFRRRRRWWRRRRWETESATSRSRKSPSTSSIKLTTETMLFCFLYRPLLFSIRQLRCEIERGREDKFGRLLNWRRVDHRVSNL